MVAKKIPPRFISSIEFFFSALIQFFDESISFRFLLDIMSDIKIEKNMFLWDHEKRKIRDETETELYRSISITGSLKHLHLAMVKRGNKW